MQGRGLIVYRSHRDTSAQRLLCRSCHTSIAFWRGTMLLDTEYKKIILPDTTSNLVVSYPAIIRTWGSCQWVEMHCFSCKSFLGLMNIEAEPRSYFIHEGRIELFLAALKFWTGSEMREAVELTSPDNPF